LELNKQTIKLLSYQTEALYAPSYRHTHTRDTRTEGQLINNITAYAIGKLSNKGQLIEFPIAYTSIYLLVKRVRVQYM
jgi:hypothetical protein